MAYYFDTTQLKCAVGFWAGDGHQIVYTGTEIHREPEKYREFGKKFTLTTGLHFWFADEGPAENFYTVPKMELVAYDSRGGYLAQLDETWVYIDAEKACYQLPKNTQLLSMSENWRKHLQPLEGIRIFSSRSEAEMEFQILDFPQPME